MLEETKMSDAEIEVEAAPAGREVQTTRAGDGRSAIAKMSRGSDLLRYLERGQLDVDLFDRIRDVTQECANFAAGTEKAGKGHVTLKLAIEVDERGVAMVATMTDKRPVLPRRKSIMWQSEDGNGFAAFPPREEPLFGDGERTVRNIT
jgi:hypothetical protein